jgi:hypothetical protein
MDLLTFSPVWVYCRGCTGGAPRTARSAASMWHARRSAVASAATSSIPLAPARCTRRTSSHCGQRGSDAIFPVCLGAPDGRSECFAPRTARGREAARTARSRARCGKGYQPHRAARARPSRREGNQRALPPERYATVQFGNHAVARAGECSFRREEHRPRRVGDPNVITPNVITHVSNTWNARP